MLPLHLSEFPPGHGMLLADTPKKWLTLNRAKCCWIGYPWSCASLALFGVILQWYTLKIRAYLNSWKFSKIMDDLSIQNLYLNFSKTNPKSTQQGYPPWSALALIRVWPWIKLLHLPPFPDHPVLILSICWRCCLFIFLNSLLGMGCCWLIPQTMFDLE